MRSRVTAARCLSSGVPQRPTRSDSGAARHPKKVRATIHSSLTRIGTTAGTAPAADPLKPRTAPQARFHRRPLSLSSQRAPARVLRRPGARERRSGHATIGFRATHSSRAVRPSVPATYAESAVLDRSGRVPLGDQAEALGSRLLSVRVGLQASRPGRRVFGAWLVDTAAIETGGGCGGAAYRIPQGSGLPRPAGRTTEVELACGCQLDATMGPASGGSQQASKSHCP